MGDEYLGDKSLGDRAAVYQQVIIVRDSNCPSWSKKPMPESIKSKFIKPKSIKSKSIKPEPTKTYNCQDQDSPSWQARQQEAVNLLVRCIKQSESAMPVIGDFGCGNCGIKRLLDESASSDFQYYGYDIKPQSELATQIDLRHSFPSDMRFDAAVCLGLIEYMEDIRPFLSYLRENCKFVVLSYVYDSGAYDAEDIARLGWANHFKKEEIDKILKEIGFAWDDELILKQKYFLRLLY